ncbi:peptidoglycan-binding protein [Desulfosarcina ovata]|uniref:Peptidoglycan binding-like domain-containing protein n=1 Tax=Desulfosarcina ovata subsp. ovata TaxID=2752305 RepID=A0A5K8AEH4_9BACT|nr:peptidoglycan-binding domain-containing protein [Desulfosarcina ovata]BBO90360.1 hypothetical protein DSCOOX_35400 [Desulfosarcina ovata subsp. ovata]
MKKWHIVVTGLFIMVCLTVSPAFAGKYNQQTHQAQSQLKALGYQPGPADGMMGQKTRNAVKQFQGDHGLPKTGTIDDRTMQKMQTASQKKGMSSTMEQQGHQAASATGGAAKSSPNAYKAQKRLKALGYQPGPADGKMGQKTKKAVKRFQRDHGLPETGNLDDRTMQKMQTAPQKKGQTGANSPQGDERQQPRRPKG